MEVNFDGLRKHLINDYNSLVRILNREVNGDNEITIDPQDIQRQLDGIRTGLVALAFTYQDGEDGFSCLDDDTHFETFRPTAEDL